MSKDLFVDTMEKHYRELLRTDYHYRFAAENTKKSVATFRKAVGGGHISFDGPACRATCEELGVERTPESIAYYMGRTYRRKLGKEEDCFNCEGDLRPLQGRGGRLARSDG